MPYKRGRREYLGSWAAGQGLMDTLASADFLLWVSVPLPSLLVGENHGGDCKVCHCFYYYSEPVTRKF